MNCTRKLILLVLIGIALISNAQQLKVFEGNKTEFEQQLSKSKKNGLIIFHTSWCGYCKKMDQTTFKDQDVISILNKHFIVWKVDAEDAIGTPLSKQYGVKGFPTTVVVDKKMSLLKSIAGYKSALLYIQELNTYISKSVANEQVDNALLQTLQEIKETEYKNALNSYLSSHPDLRAAYGYGANKRFFEMEELSIDSKHPQVSFFFDLGIGNKDKIFIEYTKSEDVDMKRFLLLHLLLTEETINDQLQKEVNEMYFLSDRIDVKTDRVFMLLKIGEEQEAEQLIKDIKKAAPKNSLDAAFYNF